LASKFFVTLLLMIVLSASITIFAYINREQVIALNVLRICILLFIFSSFTIAVSGLTAPIFLKALSHSSTPDPFVSYLMKMICSKMRLKPPRLYLSNSTNGFNALQVGMGSLSSMFLIGNPKPTMGFSDIEAVLAHELSHIKLKHSLKMLFFIVLSITLLSLSNFYLLTLFPKQPALNYFDFLIYFLVNAAGVSCSGLILLSLKRRFELQADFLAAQTCGYEQYIQTISKVYGRSAEEEQCGKLLEKLFSGHPCYYQRVTELQRRFGAS